MFEDAALVSALEDLLERGSQGRRIQMLGRLTDLFVEGANAFTNQHLKVFDDVFNRLIAEVETEARVQLSVRLAAVGNAPPQIVRRLAEDDDIGVAGPVLQHSERLEEPDLVAVANSKSQGHLLAIANRSEIAEAITDVIVRRGNREVVRSVAGNPGARLSEASFARLVKKAEKDGFLAEKVGHRADISPSVFRELVEQSTQVVLTRLFATAKPKTRAQLRRLLGEISRETETAGAPRSYAAAQRAVLGIQRTSKLDEAAVAQLGLEKRYEETVAALSLLCRVSIEVIDQLMTDERADPILVLCKAAGLTWPTARAIVRLRNNGRSMSSHSIESTCRKFERMSVSAAQFVVRSWQAQHVRKPAN